MSGTALYKALKSANADDDLATTAANEVDDINTRLTRIETMGKINIAVNVAVLVILIKSFL